MNPPENTGAFGAPGIEPRWTSSAKEGVGTAYHTSCRLWFTLSHGIINEIYYPRVDQPNTRDFQFLISDGETFCHEEKRDLIRLVEYPETNCVFYRLTNSERDGRYRIIKHILTDPHRSVLLVHTKLEVLDESLRGKLRLYALLALHGAGNSGRCFEIGASTLIHAQREDVHLVLGCSSGFIRRSATGKDHRSGVSAVSQNRKQRSSKEKKGHCTSPSIRNFTQFFLPSQKSAFCGQALTNRDQKGGRSSSRRAGLAYAMLSLIVAGLICGTPK